MKAQRVEGPVAGTPQEAVKWSWGEPIVRLRRVIERGGILALPTGSSYALAVDPASEAGVDAVYQLKHREAGKPLPVVAADLGQLERLGVEFDDTAAALAREWPAPFSLVLPSAAVPAAAGTGSLAVRLPEYAPLRALLADLGLALTATSANHSGQPPILSLADLTVLLDGFDAMVVDGGVLPGGAPSTLLQVVDGRPRVLRPGRWPVSRLEAVLGNGAPK